MDKKKYAIVENGVDTDELFHDLFDNYGTDCCFYSRFHGFKDTYEEACQAMETLKSADDDYCTQMKKMHRKEPKVPSYRIVVISINVKEYD